MAESHEPPRPSRPDFPGWDVGQVREFLGNVSETAIAQNELLREALVDISNITEDQAGAQAAVERAKLALAGATPLPTAP